MAPAPRGATTRVGESPGLRAELAKSPAVAACGTSDAPATGTGAPAGHGEQPTPALVHGASEEARERVCARTEGVPIGGACAPRFHAHARRGRAISKGAVLQKL